MDMSKRQKQIARLIEEELNVYFVKNRLTMMHGGMVSISKVQVTPDLLECRIYLSVFQIKDEKSILALFREKTGEIRRTIGNNMRHQLRSIPTLDFFLDDTLDYVYKMEAIFNKISEEDEQIGGDNKEETE